MELRARNTRGYSWSVVVLPCVLGLLQRMDVQQLRDLKLEDDVPLPG